MTAFGKSAKAGLSLLLALALIIAGAILLWGKAAAHDYNSPERWDTSITPMTTSVDTNYDWAILSAANDYNFNTDLAVDWCNSPCGNIRHYEGEYGMTQWAARTTYPLHPGGIIRYATTTWNADHGPFDSDDANYIARHEMGHAFGFRHFECNGAEYAWSVMVYGCTDGLPSVLTEEHDITDINNKY